ncbi:MAG: sigma-54 dependent transcriptional regulator [Pseudomonadota bacterium]
MNNDYTILCVDDDENFLAYIRDRLSDYNVITTTSLKHALSLLNTEDIDTLLLDIDLKGESGLDGLRDIKEMDASVDIVMVTGHRDPKFVVQAIKAGASDYICKPINSDDLLVCIEKSKKIRLDKKKIDALMSELNNVDISSRIVGRSKAFCNLIKTADKVKGHLSANVLIEGESGTGKELLARYIHRLEGDRPNRPLIVVNCAAIPENLIESELFGHEKGAFTGATKNKLGKFALADGGDIFLDEVSTLKIETQAKLLRIIQEGEFCPLGSNVSVKSTFRVIAASNDDLEKMVAQGRFRLDLYHRLKIITLTTPSLRDRKEDIEDLVLHFLKKYSEKGKEKQITKSAIEKLERHDWPGNIRELENVIHSAAIFSEKEIIDESNITIPTCKSVKYNGGIMNLSPSVTGNIIPLKKFVSKVEREYIKESIDLMNGSKEETAKHLGIGRTTLFAKLKKTTKK